MTAPRAHFHNLDALRGVCAVLVALFHTGWMSNLRCLPIVANGWLFVDFFFVLSGFVIANAYASIGAPREARDFIVRRFFRLYPLHLVTFVGAAVVTGVGMRWREGEATVSAAAWPGARLDDVVASLLLVHGFGFSQPSFNAPSWSISAEFWTYVVFAGVAIWLRKEGAKRAAMAGLGGLALGWLAFANWPHGLFTAFDHGFPRCVTGFAIGTVVCWAAQQTRAVASRQAMTLGFGVLALATLVLLHGVGQDRPSNILALPIFAAWVYACAIDRGGPIKNLLEMPAATALGRLSYSIYMVHTTVGIVVSFLVTRWAPELKGAPTGFGRDLLLGDAICATYLGVVLAVSVVSHRLVEEPGRRLGRYLQGQRSIGPRMV